MVCPVGVGITETAEEVDPYMNAAPYTPPPPRQSYARVTRLRFGPTGLLLTAGSALLAACATPVAPPPPPPPPPPAVVEAVPYRPLPPGGAHYVMDVPQRGPDGRRITVNSNLSDDQLVWNLRSAWNVAALNCLTPEYSSILEGYRVFLSRNIGPLKAINDRIEKSYTSRFRARRDAMVARDGYTTRVYNFFALPAARSGFCRAALDLANRALAAPPTDPLSFARANFDGLVLPFDQFFVEYEGYQRASAEWDAKWGAQYGPSQPGWVVVQQARASGMAVPESNSPAGSAIAAQSDIGSQAGVVVPVIPVTEGVISQPVVEPFAAPPEPKPGQ